MRRLIMQPSPASCHLGLNILFSYLFSNILKLRSSRNVRDKVSHPKNRQITPYRLSLTAYPVHSQFQLVWKIQMEPIPNSVSCLS